MESTAVQFDICAEMKSSMQETAEKKKFAKMFIIGEALWQIILCLKKHAPFISHVQLYMPNLFWVSSFRDVTDKVSLSLQRLDKVWTKQSWYFLVYLEKQRTYSYLKRAMGNVFVCIGGNDIPIMTI